MIFKPTKNNIPPVIVSSVSNGRYPPQSEPSALVTAWITSPGFNTTFTGT